MPNKIYNVNSYTVYENKILAPRGWEVDKDSTATMPRRRQMTKHEATKDALIAYLKIYNKYWREGYER